MKKNIAFIITVLFIFSAACKKKDKTTCNADLAGISGTYKFGTIIYKATASSPGVDGSSYLGFESCDLDNTITFKTDKSYILTDAGVKCNPADDDTGTWDVSSTSLTLDGGPNTIETFDCGKLVFSFSDAVTTGDKITITLNRQ